jgi:two-component system NtrC family sensor kinase
MSLLDHLKRRLAAWAARDDDFLRDEAARLRADLAALEARIREDALERERQEEMLRRVEGERRAEDERARRAERLATVGATLAGAAHELNNPLSAIRGFAQLLLAGEHMPANRAALETIEREAKRASRIVKDLLGFTRPGDSGEHRRVGLNAVVTHIAATRRYAMQSRGIDCRVYLDPALPTVVGDAALLEQLVLNLVVNAEQAVAEELDRRPALPPGGRLRSPARVSTRTRLDGGVAELAVEDSGPGISPAAAARIWEPFFTTKSGGEGTGIGLSIARSVALEHGGTIEIEPAHGSGACFVVRLPACTLEDAADASARDETARGRAQRPLDVLAADDDRALLDFVTAFLSGRGHTVLCAGDGAEALRLADQARFDVVLCDLRMPNVDGAEVIERLRARGCEGTRFVLATSAHGEPDARARIDRAAPHALVRKPYELEELRLAIETA